MQSSTAELKMQLDRRGIHGRLMPAKIGYAVNIRCHQHATRQMFLRIFATTKEIAQEDEERCALPKQSQRRLMPRAHAEETCTYGW